jgi:hypothetical protein
MCGETVGGIGVVVETGSEVNVGSIGDDVIVGETDEGIKVGAHPLVETIVNTNARNTDTTDLSMLFSLLILLCKTAPNGSTLCWGHFAITYICGCKGRITSNHLSALQMLLPVMLRFIFLF